MLIRLEALRHAPGLEFCIVLGAVVTLLVLQAVEIISTVQVELFPRAPINNNTDPTPRSARRDACLSKNPSP